MTPRADVAIVGLGAAGSAAALALARRGCSVLGLDRFHPPHALGSTHGRSRIIREAYYESPVYVPLVRRAYELWRALEHDSGRLLLRETGGLMLGAPGGELVDGARRSAELHRLPFELLAAPEIRRRFPVFRAEDHTAGILEPRAGFLDPEACLESFLALATGAGATLWFDTPVAHWESAGTGLRLHTTRGPIECGRLILAAGPWLGELVGGLSLPLTVERQVMFWFQPGVEPERFGADRLPVFIWEWDAGRFFYGIPDAGSGFKVAPHHEGVSTSAVAVDRAVRDAEIAAMREILRRCIPDADGPPTDAATCLYTNTPDHHFVLGEHPHDPRVLIASPCSGHGFKFASAIGEVLADLVTSGQSRFDLTPFSPRRFTAT